MLHEMGRKDDFSPVDFSFVYSLDENTLNLFFDITDLTISAMIESIEGDVDYVSKVTPEKNLEIQAYFSNLLELYTDYELYDECEGIIQIINTFEKGLYQ